MKDFRTECLYRFTEQCHCKSLEHCRDFKPIHLSKSVEEANRDGILEAIIDLEVNPAIQGEMRRRINKKDVSVSDIPRPCAYCNEPIGMHYTVRDNQFYHSRCYDDKLRREE